MILEAFYLASGFTFLRAIEKPASLQPAKTEQICLSLIRESAEIFGISLLVILIQEIIHKTGIGILPQEERIPLLAAISYGSAKILKKENTFFAALFAFGIFILNSATENFSDEIRRLITLIFFFAMTRFGLEGLRFRLLFSSPPKHFAGMPILIFSFSIFLMILSVLKGMVQ